MPYSNDEDIPPRANSSPIPQVDDGAIMDVSPPDSPPDSPISSIGAEADEMDWQMDYSLPDTVELFGCSIYCDCECCQDEPFNFN